MNKRGRNWRGKRTTNQATPCSLGQMLRKAAPRHGNPRETCEGGRLMWSLRVSSKPNQPRPRYRDGFLVFFALSPVSNQVVKKRKRKEKVAPTDTPLTVFKQMQERPLLPTAGAVTNTALQVLLACLCSPAGEQTELGCGLISTYLQTEDTHALGPSQRGLSLYCQAPPEPVERRGSGQAVTKPNVKHAPIPFACPD